MEDPIVVGTDGSETATKAVAEAIRLSAALGHELHIVSAYKPLRSGSGVPAEFDGQLNSRAVVDGILEDAAARARVGGAKAVTHAVTGDPAEALIDVAEKVNASMLVIGNKGLNSVKRFVLGSVPNHVVHHAPCSTLIVHTT